MKNNEINSEKLCENRFFFFNYEKIENNFQKFM